MARRLSSLLGAWVDDENHTTSVIFEVETNGYGVHPVFTNPDSQSENLGSRSPAGPGHEVPLRTLL